MSRQCHDPIGARRAPRARTVAASTGIAAAAVAGCIALFGFGAGSAAAATFRPAPSQIELSATPANGLPATNAEITVRGSGFDTKGELWVAVCQDDGVAPEEFTHCLGGAIPDSNASTAWAVVTRDGKPRYAGPVNEKFGKSGDFKLTLQIPVASGQDADCVSDSCSVYTRSANPDDRSQDAAVRVGFSFAPSTPGSGPAPSTEVIGGDSTPVPPDSVLAPQATLGGDQSIVFSGFTPGEVVDATLYSDPIPLPSVQADSNGAATIAFTVPDDLPVGEHLVQAVGAQSGRVGVAQFTVIAAPVTTSPSPTETTQTSMTSPTTSAALTSEAAAVPAPTTPTTPDLTTSAPATTAESTEAAAEATAPAAGGSGGFARLVWLWVTLAALIVIGGAVAIVAMLRRRSDHAEYQPPLQPIDEVLSAPSWHDMPQSSEPYAAGTYGAGSADPAGDYSGGTADPFRVQDEPYRPLAGDDPGPATEQWQPGFDATPPAQQGFDSGPATEQWRPDFEGGPADGTDQSRGGAAGQESTAAPSWRTSLEPDQDGGAGAGGGRHRGS